MKSRMSMMVAGLVASIGGTMMPTQNRDYNSRQMRVLSYKTGRRPFTRGKRSKSLKVRANRGKAKARAKKR